jgi:hypothetical protein
VAERVRAGETRVSIAGATPRRGDGQALDELPMIVEDVLSSPGIPLGERARALMEPCFGRDFSQVRVHADAEAARSAQAIRARAYAAGDSIVFAAGQFTLEASEGRALLAHELAHVTQDGGNAGIVRRSPDDQHPAPPPATTAERLAEVAGLVSEGKALGVDIPRTYLDKLAKTNPVRFQKAVTVLRDHLDDVAASHSTPRSRELADVQQAARQRGLTSSKAPAETKMVKPQKSTVRQSHDLGVEGGRAKAGEHGITVLDWNNPEGHKGDYGEGFDDIGAKADERIILEYKGETSKLATGQWSDEWVGSRIAKLEYLNDPMARELLAAADKGNLRGRVYRTTVVDGKPHTVLEQRRTYSATKVRRAYEVRLNDVVARLGPRRAASKATVGELPPGSVFARDPVSGNQPSIMADDPALRGQVRQGAETAHVASGSVAQGATALPPGSVFARDPVSGNQPSIMADDPALRGQVTRGAETTQVASGAIAQGRYEPPKTGARSVPMRGTAAALGLITVASEIMASIGAVQDVQRNYNDRMLAIIQFFAQYGEEPDFEMEEVKTGTPVSKSAKPSTGALYGTWVAPLIGHVDVPALLALLPTRLPTLQSLVEFLGTGRVLQVIEQKGTHYYLTGPGIPFTEITGTVEQIRSDLMRGLDDQSRKQMAAKGAAGVYRIRSADVTIYRYGASVREPWRLGHTQVPNLAAHEFSSANMWVREIGAKGDSVHVEPANAEAEAVAQNATYIVPMSIGDTWDEVKGSGRKIEYRSPTDRPLQAFVAAPLPPELGYTRYIKHPDPDYREFTIAVGELRQFWVDRDDLELVPPEKVKEYAGGTPAAPPPTHFFRSEQRQNLPGF